MLVAEVGVPFEAPRTETHYRFVRVLKKRTSLVDAVCLATLEKGAKEEGLEVCPWSQPITGEGSFVGFRRCDARRTSEPVQRCPFEAYTDEVDSLFLGPATPNAALVHFMEKLFWRSVIFRWIPTPRQWL